MTEGYIAQSWKSFIDMGGLFHVNLRANDKVAFLLVYTITQQTKCRKLALRHGL